jgi:hypothetical protein
MYEITDNPAFAGQTPRLLKPACHDGTSFITFRCHCGQYGHIHESQVRAGISKDAVLALRCSSCLTTDTVSVSAILDAFQTLQDQGWADR